MTEPRKNERKRPALSVGAAMVIGIGVGTALGVALDNVAVGAGLHAAGKQPPKDRG